MSKTKTEPLTMNEQDDMTRHEYNGYMLETLQLEYERDQEMRDIVQAQNVCDEHTNANATQVAADGMMTGDVGDVNTRHDVGDVRGWGIGRELGRPVTYRTGVVAPDGYCEQVTTMLCWRCDQEAEYAGYCEPHYEQWLQEQAEDEMQEHDEWLDDLWSAEELERAQREQEERRDDH